MALRLILVASLATLAFAGSFDMFGDDKKPQMSMSDFMAMMNTQQQSGWGSSQQNGWGSQQQSGWGPSLNFQMKGKMQPNWDMSWFKQQQQKQETTTQSSWMQDHSQENVAAYMKWCAEKKERQMLVDSQKQFMEWMKTQQEEKETAMAKLKMEYAAKERQAKIHVQYEQWKSMFTQQQNFQGLLYKFNAMKQEYMHTMICELLTFCKCQDVNTQLKKYFYYSGGNSTTLSISMSNDMFDLEDITDLIAEPIGDLALKVSRMSEEAKTNLFFGGIVSNLCTGAREFAEHVKNWEAHFM